MIRGLRPPSERWPQAQGSRQSAKVERNVLAATPTTSGDRSVQGRWRRSGVHRASPDTFGGPRCCRYRVGERAGRGAGQVASFANASGSHAQTPASRARSSSSGVGSGDSEASRRGGQLQGQGESTCPGFSRSSPECACEGRETQRRINGRHTHRRTGFEVVVGGQTWRCEMLSMRAIQRRSLRWRHGQRRAPSSWERVVDRKFQTKNSDLDQLLERVESHHIEIGENTQVCRQVWAPRHTGGGSCSSGGHFVE